MAQFGFELSVTGFNFGNEEEQQEETENEEEDAEDFHRDTTINQYNLFNYDDTRVEGFYNMPILF
ncbi:Uncharacterised protein [Streptococcus pneumoniae]|nr:Uncharacterised protein [Streptococcus pneumoniae]SNJ24889.1 Uncharacterised protein [Streptococcus pneumoniae]